MLVIFTDIHLQHILVDLFSLRMNEVNTRRARLVLEWVYHLSMGQGN